MFEELKIDLVESEPRITMNSNHFDISLYCVNEGQKVGKEISFHNYRYQFNFKLIDPVFIQILDDLDHLMLNRCFLTCKVTEKQLFTFFNIAGYGHHYNSHRKQLSFVFFLDKHPNSAAWAHHILPKLYKPIRGNCK